MAEPIKVLIVEDHDQFRQFIANALRNTTELRVIAEVADGMEAIQKARELRPDLILLDIGLPTLNGIEAARRIREVSPRSRILFVSGNRSSDVVREALSTGASGYVVKSDAGRDLLPAVRAVLAGKRFVNASLARRDFIHLVGERTTEQVAHEKVLAPSEPQTLESNHHELRLYSEDAAFVSDFAHSIGSALKNGNVMLVIATESHRADLLWKLSADGVDIDAASERRFYTPLDVSDSLPTIMNTSTDNDGFAKRLPGAIVQALRTAKENHRHLAVG